MINLTKTLPVDHMPSLTITLNVLGFVVTVDMRGQIALIRTGLSWSGLVLINARMSEPKTPKRERQIENDSVTSRDIPDCPRRLCKYS